MERRDEVRLRVLLDAESVTSLYSDCSDCSDCESFSESRGGSWGSSEKPSSPSALAPASESFGNFSSEASRLRGVLLRGCFTGWHSFGSSASTSQSQEHFHLVRAG